MRNRERFYEAFAHTGHRVMGRRMAKLTLRHLFWLRAMRSPLVEGGEVGPADLERAAMVCALPYRTLDRRLPWLLARGPSWWGKARFARMTLWRRKDEEYAAFQAYLLDFGCPPATHHDEPEIGGEGAEDGGDPEDAEVSPLPDLFSLVSGLVRMTSWTPDTVWALGPGEAEWWMAGVGTHRGLDMKLKSPSDEAFEEEIRRERAAVEAKNEEAAREAWVTPEEGSGETLGGGTPADQS